MIGRCAGHAIAILIAVAVALPATAEKSLEARARDIETKLMAPCCMAGPISDHNSTIAFQMRDEIRAMLAEGQTEEQILDHYVAEYGPQILALPEAKGFNLTAYLLPALMMIGAAVALGIAMRRWRAAPASRAATAAPAVPSVASGDQAYLERLERELEDFD